MCILTLFHTRIVQYSHTSFFVFCRNGGYSHSGGTMASARPRLSSIRVEPLRAKDPDGDSDRGIERVRAKSGSERARE